MQQRRFVLLDRDGTINVERDYLSGPDGLELYPNTIAGLRRLQELGLGLAVVTNQSAIGRGFFDWERLEEIHQRLEVLLNQGEVTVEDFFVCPHVPEDSCQCRKPEPGLAMQAAQKLGFDLQEAFVIGDKACDIGLGQRIGATTLLVRTGYGNEEIARGQVCPDFVVADLAEAAQVIEAIVGTGLGLLDAKGNF